MLSTFVLLPAGEGLPAPGPLVRTLGALVPAIVEGLVRDVTVLSPVADDGIRGVADHAGCKLVEQAGFGAALAAAVAGARCPTLFLLRAGAFLDRGFVDEVGQQIGPPGGGAPRPLLIREAPDGLVTRVLPARAPVAGLILPAAGLHPPARSFAALVRRQRGARTLRTRASSVR